MREHLGPPALAVFPVLLLLLRRLHRLVAGGWVHASRALTRTHARANATPQVRRRLRARGGARARVCGRRAGA